MKTALWIVIGLVVAVPFALLAAGQIGLLRGAMPADLGLNAGRLKPPSRTANSVSSQAAAYDWPAASTAQIEPIAFASIGAADAAQALGRIEAVVHTMPGATVVRSAPGYLYVQFETRWLKFVDDAEFAVPAGETAVQLRSASRLGRRDFGVNRARIESIRAALRGPS